MARPPCLALALILVFLAGCHTPRPVPPRAAPAPPPPVETGPSAPSPSQAIGPTPEDQALPPPPAAPPAIVVSPAAVPSLKVIPLRDGVWLYSASGAAEGGGDTNGLIVQEQGRLVLVDAPSSEANTAALLEWVQAELGQPIARAILTRAAAERLGGTPLLQQEGIPLVALAPICARIAALGRPRPTSLGELAPGGSIRVGAVELFHPGPEPDFHQAIVWVRDGGVLFAGCAARPMTATDLGQATPDDLKAWPVAIRRILQRYPDATVVVPGQGPPGGRELLHHTLRLLATSGR